MLNILLSIGPVFSVILLGTILANRQFLATNIWDGLEKITYYILFPALIVITLSRVDFHMEKVHQAILSVALATLFISATLIVLKGFWHIQSSAFTSVFQGSTRYNSYLFLAISYVLWQEQGVSICAIIIGYMIVITNFSSILVLSYFRDNGRVRWQSIFISIGKNPIIIASIIGVVFSLVEIPLDWGLNLVLEILGKSSFALSLLAVGANLRISALRNARMYVVFTVAVKLIVLPAMVYILTLWMNIDGIYQKVAILYGALPCAANAYILAKQMNGNAQLMASIITATTLCSGVTIPTIIFLLG